jgi:hypothetical protein
MDILSSSAVNGHTVIVQVQEIDLESCGVN